MKRWVATLLGLLLLAPLESFSFATGKEVSLERVELLEPTGNASCDDDGVLDTGELARVRVTLRNSGTERLQKTSMTLSSADPGVSFPEGPTVSFPASEPLELVSAELPVKLSGSTDLRKLTLRIDYRDAEQQVPGNKTHTVTYPVNTDELPETSTLETVEALQHPWTITPSPESLPPWMRQLDSTGANGFFFHGPDNGEPGTLDLVSPPLQVSETVAFRIIFEQRYDFETNASGIPYDGAVIELSDDDGLNWVDLGTSVNPTYNETLHAGTVNPLQGQPAYGGQSPSYPAFIKTTISLGTTYAGKTVRIRFRIGTDDSTSVTDRELKGWDLDNFQLEGVKNKPFTSRVAHRGECLNRAPVASVKPVAAVDEGTLVTLEGSATDVNEGTVFVYTWTQVDGPPVTLGNSTSATPTFTAPQVDADTTLTFWLVVGDGELESETVSVSVLVRDVPNKAPVARAGEDQTVREGSGVTLNGSGSTDPDGGALTYTWTQVDGPTVNLLEAGPRAMFNAPDVDEETAFTFRLQVTDADGDSSEDTVTVRVTNRQETPLPDAGGCGAGPEGGVPTMALLVLAALGLTPRRRSL